MANYYDALNNLIGPFKEYVTEDKIASLFSIQSISEDAQNHTQSFVS